MSTISSSCEKSWNQCDSFTFQCTLAEKIEKLEHFISSWVNTSSYRKYRIHMGDLNVVMFAIEQFSETV